MLRSLFFGLDFGSGLEEGASDFFFETGAFLGGASSPESSRAANGFEDYVVWIKTNVVTERKTDRKKIIVRKTTVLRTNSNLELGTSASVATASLCQR